MDLSRETSLTLVYTLPTSARGPRDPSGPPGLAAASCRTSGKDLRCSCGTPTIHAIAQMQTSRWAHCLKKTKKNAFGLEYCSVGRLSSLPSTTVTSVV